MRPLLIVAALCSVALATVGTFPYPPVSTAHHHRPAPKPTSVPTPTPSPAPTPTASPSPTTAPPTYAGCPVFTANDPAYNANIGAASPDPLSSAYIAGLGSNSSWSNDEIETLNTADASTPIVSVGSKKPYHVMPPEPWLPSFKIEPVSDAHSFVLDKATCHVYELYQTTYANGALSAYSGGDWDLTKPFVVSTPPASGPNATRTSMFAGAVKYPELAAGQINHALLLIVPYNMASQWGFGSPAAGTDGIVYEGPGPLPMPYGAKLRLRADYPTAGLGPQALTVVRTLQTYGAIVSDTGCCYKLIFMHDPATLDAFDFSQLDALKPKPTDWTVVTLPAVQCYPGHPGCVP